MSHMMQLDQIVLGRYQVDDIIAMAGQAVIGCALGLHTNQRVIIKQLAASPGQKNYFEELERFKRAAHLRINHPNVVDPTHYGEENGQWYTVMPFVEGDTLDVYLSTQGGKLNWQEATFVVVEVAKGLEACHAQGVIHRDIKPANIMITPRGGACIIDFGICKILDQPTITCEGSWLGTPASMAPEQALDPSKVDCRTDLYSVGVVLYWLLTGESTVRGDTPELMAMSLAEYIPPAPHKLDRAVPIALSDACMKLLSKSPHCRFPNARALLDVLLSVSRSGQLSLCCSCHQPLRPESHFCVKCGTPQSINQMVDLRCLACGTQIVGNESHCSSCRRPFSHSNHRLIFIAGPAARRECHIPEGRFEVGRDQLAPHDFHVSRRHLLVSCSNGSVQLKDAGSTNRTYVAGQLANQPILLVTGQEIRIADNVATYQQD